LSNLLIYSIPVFIAALVVERWWAARYHGVRAIRGYEKRDLAASLAMGIGNVIISAFTSLLAVALWSFAYEHRVMSLGSLPAWFSLPLLFLGEDLCYYWFHRLHHDVRFLWAAHVVHHSSQHFNLSTALRQPWFTPVTGPVFWLPLALVGFSPLQILSAQAVSLIYQFWIHTEAVARLPRPIEWLFNTPSHHRVHHGRNVRYLDRNHGGVLIVWDRLFGSFQAEEEPVEYGLTHNILTFNPVRIASHEYLALGRDLARARTFRETVQYLLAPPGWSPDGSSHTAAQLRRASNRGPNAVKNGESAT